MSGFKKVLFFLLVVFCSENTFANSAKLIKIVTRATMLKNKIENMPDDVSLLAKRRWFRVMKFVLMSNLNDVLTECKMNMVIAKDGCFAVVPDEYIIRLLERCLEKEKTNRSTRDFDLGSLASGVLEKVTDLNISGEQLSGIVGDLVGGVGGLQVHAHRIDLNDFLQDDDVDIVGDAAEEDVEHAVETVAGHLASSAEDIPAVAGHFITSVAAQAADAVDEALKREQDRIINRCIFARALSACFPCLFRQR